MPLAILRPRNNCVCAFSLTHNPEEDGIAGHFLKSTRSLLFELTISMSFLNPAKPRSFNEFKIPAYLRAYLAFVSPFVLSPDRPYPQDPALGSVGVVFVHGLKYG